MRKIIIIGACALIVLTAVAFSYFYEPPSPPLTGDLNAWSGTWISNKTKKHGEFDVYLQQLEGKLSGNIKIYGSPITKGGQVSGFVDGNSIKFGLGKDGRGMLKYSGTISKNTMSGIWTIPLIGDHGQWEAKKEL